VIESRFSRNNVCSVRNENFTKISVYATSFYLNEVVGDIFSHICAHFLAKSPNGYWIIQVSTTALKYHCTGFGFLYTKRHGFIIFNKSKLIQVIKYSEHLQLKRVCLSGITAEFYAEEYENDIDYSNSIKTCARCCSRKIG